MRLAAPEASRDAATAREMLNRGRIHLELEKSADALTYLDRALVLDPQSAIAWAAKGVVMVNLCRYDEVAVPFFEMALNMNPDFARA